MELLRRTRAGDVYLVQRDDGGAPFVRNRSGRRRRVDELAVDAARRGWIRLDDADPLLLDDVLDHRPALVQPVGLLRGDGGRRVSTTGAGQPVDPARTAWALIFYRLTEAGRVELETWEARLCSTT